MTPRTEPVFWRDVDLEFGSDALAPMGPRRKITRWPKREKGRRVDVRRYETCTWPSRAQMLDSFAEPNRTTNA